jgi:hypothetical protein
LGKTHGDSLCLFLAEGVEELCCQHRVNVIPFS